MKCLSPEKIAEYQLSALSPDDMNAVTEHLLICDKCRREADTLTATVALLGNTPMPEPSVNMWPAISARINRRPVNHWVIPAVIGAATMLVIGVISFRSVPTESIAKADEYASPYVATHQVITAGDLLSDRAGIAASLIYSGDMK